MRISVCSVGIIYKYKFIVLNSVSAARTYSYITVIPRTYSVFYGHRSKNKL